MPTPDSLDRDTIVAYAGHASIGSPAVPVTQQLDNE